MHPATRDALAQRWRALIIFALAAEPVSPSTLGVGVGPADDTLELYTEPAEKG
jgi:hypothetical protein